MGLKIAVLLFLVSCAAGQNFRVCININERTLCNSLDRDGSQAICVPVESRIDCAIKLARGEADIGVFNEEETLLLGHQQPNDHRVVATIRDISRTEPVAFEAVAVVQVSHTGGLEGLRGARYCHPGFGTEDLRWSPRVLRAFEQATARTDRCTDAPPQRSVDELEVEALSRFFPSACRPGPWSVNATVDASLKSQFPGLCSLCGSTTPCAGYGDSSTVNRHIAALECLRANTTAGVAYVAWQHVREFFVRETAAATSHAVLCPDGSTLPLTSELMASATAPCAFVRQPWPTVVANTANAAAVQSSLNQWWPAGANPSDSSWRSTLFSGVVGGASARVFFDDTLPTPRNYSQNIRPIAAIDATAGCLPARRWCTLSAAEQTKCSWVRTAAYILGIQPTISCQQRATVLTCLDDIRNDRADFIASASNYGYLARVHYKLSPVKLVQNSNSAANSFSRVAAFVRADSNVTRFENLRGRRACFPEFGGIAFVAFVRAAQERSVISASECDYARAVGEFFAGACAPGALDAAHALGESNYDATSLCTACRPTASNIVNASAVTCTWDYDTNLYFGNNGSLSCLANTDNDVAFLQTQNMASHLTQLGLQASQFRALCRNNTLAVTAGTAIDDNCLLAHVVDAEVVTRRNDGLTNALSVMLESLEQYFGYNAESQSQLINLEIFSPFDGTSDLLFKDTAIALAEPSGTANVPARNYMDLFAHLEACSSAPETAVPGLSTRNIYSLVMMVIMALFTKFVVY